MPATPPTTTDAPAPKTIMRDSRTENTTDDDRIYEEAIKHILTPKRQRTTVTSESLAAIRRAVNKP